MESISSQRQEAKPVVSLPNGALKRHRHPPASAEPDVEYRECLKNHAAALGGHALDGCGEFTPSPSSDPAVPTSLTCAACGCHRNFHRRRNRLLHRHHPEREQLAVPPGAIGHDETDRQEEAEYDEAEEDEDEVEDRHCFSRRLSSGTLPAAYFSSAPHMLLALSGSVSGDAARTIPASATPPQAAAPVAVSEQQRRRARTKFTPDQKVRMQELAEKLGWRMPKRDEAASVEEFCRGIGVEKGVFKVWMHNNKQNLTGSSAKAEFGSHGSSEGNGGGGGASRSNLVLNGSPPLPP